MKGFWLLVLWIRETFTGLYRNFWGNLTAVLLTCACLFLFAVSFVTGLNAKYFANELNDKIEIKVNLKNTVTDYAQIATKLKDIKGVSDLRFVSKDEAYKIVEKDMGDNAAVLHAVGENPFPAQYIVKVSNPNQINEIVGEVKALNVSDDIQYGKEYVNKLITFTNVVQKIGYVITLAAAIFTIYIVVNVIKYNIDKRSDELRIKRLTGAGMITIRLPFVLEAVIITCLSGIAVYELFMWGYDTVSYYMQKAIGYALFLPADSVTNQLFMPLLIISTAIGLVGSYISTQRFIAKY